MLLKSGWYGDGMPKGGDPMVTVHDQHPLLQVYQRVRQEWEAAEAAFLAGDGDPDVLALRYEAARRALNACIKALKQEAGLPVHATSPALPWVGDLHGGDLHGD